MGLTPKVANIIPGSPVAFEGVPVDGLPAGTVCLSPAPAGSLRDVDVAHVVGDMEDEGLRDWILYSISLPRASYFLGVPSEDCRGDIVGLDGTQEKSMKRGKGTGHNL